MSVSIEVHLSLLDGHCWSLLTVISSPSISTMGFLTAILFAAAMAEAANPRVNVVEAKGVLDGRAGLRCWLRR